MDKSNIFVYVELSKLLANLNPDPALAKQSLKAQAGHFNIIDAKYFSLQLAPEWEQIIAILKDKGPKLGVDGQIEKNPFRNTIFQMSPQQCADMVGRIDKLFEKVKKELEFDA